VESEGSVRASSQVVERRIDGHNRGRRAGRRATRADQQQSRSKPVDARAKEIGGEEGRDRRDVRKGRGKAYESEEITTKADGIGRRRGDATVYMYMMRER